MPLEAFGERGEHEDYVPGRVWATLFASAGQRWRRTIVDHPRDRDRRGDVCALRSQAPVSVTARGVDRERPWTVRWLSLGRVARRHPFGPCAHGAWRATV